MARGRNEYFADNMIGKVVKFDVQPYNRGTMKLTSVRERDITVTEFNMERGQQTVTYSTFDIEGEVIEGSATGALWGGRPVSSKAMVCGSTFSITGVSRGQIYRAVEKGETIVIARCG